MAYNINSISVKEYVENTNIKLPRFQRKETWDGKRNFMLCISVYKDFPMGVVILNKMGNTSWLLDGRQRRNALKKMIEDPVELYKWASSFLSLRNNDAPDEVKRKFNIKIEEYLQTEFDKQHNGNEENEENDDQEYDDDDPSFDLAHQEKGLQTLLDTILMVHNKKSGKYKLERIFDYTDMISNLEYYVVSNGEKVFSPKKLRSFIISLIDDYKSLHDDNKNISKDFFIEQLVYKYPEIKSNNETKFKSLINTYWEDIEKTINTYEANDTIFKESMIGVITITKASTLDAQNIFSLVNKNGSPLNAEELLSAKPFWNLPVNNPSQEVRDEYKKLYSALKINIPEDVVRWDLAATLVSRIDRDHLIFQKNDNTEKISLAHTTLGFKLLSAIYCGGITANKVTELEKNDVINWDTGIDTLVNDLNSVIKIISEHNYFKYFKAWGKSIMELLSNAPALEFLVILYKKWNELGKPYAASAATKTLQRYAVNLYDKLVYEYALKSWRGSGDSKLAKDIDAGNINERVKKMESATWIDFLDKSSYGTFNNSDMTVQLNTPIIYHYYCLRSLGPTDTISTTYEVDHIYPQADFKDNDNVDQKLKDSYFNLALLPKKENIQKSDKKLKDLTDDWLKQEVSKYTEISLADFTKYSSLSYIDDLRKERLEKFKSAFKELRDNLFN